MFNTEIKRLLIDIPTKFCRNMNQKFVNTILKDITNDFSKHHFMILKLLYENEHLYVTEIVDILSITKPQMTASADKLIKLDYVDRKHDINDRRKIHLSITDRGKEITDQINNNIDLQVDGILNKLSKEEIKDLAVGLKVLHKFCSLCNNK